MKQIILDLHNQMKKLTIEAGVSESRYESIIADLDEFNDDELKMMLDWIYKVHENEYKELKYVKDLLPDEMWAKYDLFNITGLREQGMLKQARKEIKVVWKSPYRTKEQLKRISQRKAANKHKPIS